MRKVQGFISVLTLVVFIAGCTKTTAVEEEHSVYETMEHACHHMEDGPDTTVTAAQSGSGPHVEFEHTRINVVLVDVEGGKGGSIHFESDVTGDVLIMSDHPTALISVSNGGTALDIEGSFTQQQIADSSGCASIRKAILVEARTGANIITLGPVADADTIRLVIEEAGHHDE